MLRRCAGFVVLLCLVTAVGAAETIKLDLADFKFAPDAKGTDELFKHDDGKLCFFASGAATVKLTGSFGFASLLVISCAVTTLIAVPSARIISLVWFARVWRLLEEAKQRASSVMVVEICLMRWFIGNSLKGG